MYSITDRRKFSAEQIKLILQAHSYQYDKQLRDDGFSPTHLRNLGLEENLECIGKIKNNIIDIACFQDELKLSDGEYCLYNEHGNDNDGDTISTLQTFGINNNGRIIVYTCDCYSDIWNSYNEIGKVHMKTISVGTLFDMAGAKIFTFLCDKFDRPIEYFIEQIMNKL